MLVLASQEGKKTSFIQYDVKAGRDRMNTALLPAVVAMAAASMVLASLVDVALGLSAIPRS